MTVHATGTFDVRITPAAADDADGPAVAKMSIDKQFHGDLDALSKGAMLASHIAETGAAAYVAVEQVDGTLQGRRGTFLLLHQGTMTSDGQHLTVLVAPGSATGALVGLTGSMGIQIVEKNHFYTFDYQLPEQP